MKKYSYLLTGLIGPVSRLIFSLIFATCCLEVFGRDPNDKKTPSKKNVLYVTWHQRLIPYAWYYRFKKMVVMASMSRDGEIATQFAQAFGWIPVRGSSKKRGRKALDEMVPFVQKGYNAALASDGPTGPAYRSKMGIVSLAQKTGHPIQASMWSCDKYWVLRSWDRTLIPKPFSRIVLIFSEPIHLEKGAAPEACEEARKTLDKQLNTMMYQADRFFISKVHDPRDIPVPNPVPVPKPKESLPHSR